MESFVSISTFIHVMVGFIVLILGPFALLYKKNRSVHAIIGKVYVFGMTIIFLTALPLSVVHKKWFLLFISFFTYYSVCIGYRALIIKNGKRKFLDWLIDLIAGAANLSLLIFGVFIGFSFGWQNAVIPLIFGIAGVYFVGNHVFTYLFREKFNQDWLRVHIGNILGSYIGAVTAFTVNQAWKWDIPDIIAWIGPSVILVPLIIKEIQKTKSQKTGLSGN